MMGSDLAPPTDMAKCCTFWIHRQEKTFVSLETDHRRPSVRLKSCCVFMLVAVQFTSHSSSGMIIVGLVPEINVDGLTV